MQELFSNTFLLPSKNHAYIFGEHRFMIIVYLFEMNSRIRVSFNFEREMTEERRNRNNIMGNILFDVRSPFNAL